MSALEWFLFVRHEAWADRRDATELAHLTWARSRRTPSLRAVLVSAVGQVVVQGGEGASRPLVKHMEVLPGDEALELLDEMRRCRDDDVARRCLKSRLTPRELFRSLGLPLPRGSRAEALALGFVRAFTAKGRPTDDALVVQLLEEVATSEMMGELLRGIPADALEAHAHLRDAVLPVWGPAGPRYGELVPADQERMRAWTGSIVFRDFARIIDLMVASEALGLPEYESRRLMSRRGFWAAYQARFQGLRVLLPQKTVNTLGLQRDLERKGIERLGPGEQVVTCLMDFGDHVVVEVFQGAGEVRIIEKARSELFQVAGIGLDAIRSQPALLAHDHVFMWQPSLHRALSGIGIHPSAGVGHYESGTRRFSFRDQVGKKDIEKRRQALRVWLPGFVRSQPTETWDAERLQPLLNTWTMAELRSALGSENHGKGRVKSIHHDGYAFVDLGSSDIRDVYVPKELAKGLSRWDNVEVRYLIHEDGRLRATHVERA
ncbi:MAG: hypothetical protein H6736_22085 [Alphaproteobacteria bacterium]|nr:hypothetical protein [Alphaproteobacteria bacterium]